MTLKTAIYWVSCISILILLVSSTAVYALDSGMLDEQGDVRDSDVDVNPSTVDGIDIVEMTVGYKEKILTVGFVTLGTIPMNLEAGEGSLEYVVLISGGSGCHIETCNTYFNIGVKLNITSSGMEIKSFRSKDYQGWQYHEIGNYTIDDNRFYASIFNIPEEYHDSFLLGEMDNYWYDVFTYYYFDGSDDYISDRLFHYVDGKSFWTNIGSNITRFLLFVILGPIGIIVVIGVIFVQIKKNRE